MKALSLCKQLGSLCLLLAVCVLVVGCGGGGVDALVKEQKAIQEEMKGSAGDPTKFKAAMAKQGELLKKVMALSPAQQQEYAEKLKKEGVAP